jgi:hypothetical protein
MRQNIGMLSFAEQSQKAEAASYGKPRSEALFGNPEAAERLMRDENADRPEDGSGGPD